MSQIELPENENVLQDMLNDAILDYLAEMSTSTSGGPAYQRMMALTRAVVARGPGQTTTTTETTANANNEANNLPAPNNAEPNEPELEAVQANTTNNPKTNAKNKNKNNNPKGGRRSRKQKRQKNQKHQRRGKNTRRK